MPKKKIITITLAPELLDMVDTYNEADKTKPTRSDFIARAVAKELARVGNNSYAV